MIHYVLATFAGLFALDMSGVVFRWAFDKIGR
jgi:hypothetical protein